MQLFINQQKGNPWNKSTENKSLKQTLNFRAQEWRQANDVD